MSFVNLNPVGFQNVNITDKFWSSRIETIRNVTAWTCINQCESTHRIDNFRRAAGWQPGGHEGIYFDDSDVYKVLEGAAYVLMGGADKKLEAKVDEIIDAICAAQQEDGYLYTFYILNTPELRWTDMNRHEAYCLGHMVEGALAYVQATGKDKWLKAAVRAVEQMMRVNGPEGQHWVTGHQEIEMALIKLYRYTGEKKYLEYVQWLVEERGHGHLRSESYKGIFGRTDYCQDDLPVRELQRVTGHAVRAMYYYSAVTDLAAILGEQSLDAAMQRLWANVVPANLYLTGGIGQSAHNEGFTRDWSLPNLTAYCETCASIGMAFWNQRMNFTHGESRYADLVEREIYNGILSGISLSGDLFFYDNPLATAGTYHRRSWFGCSCCPTNVIRFIPSVGGYVFATSGEDIYLNQFIQSESVVPTAAGDVGISMRTAYPWEETVEITITRCEGSRTLRVRKPGWCTHARLMQNGAAVEKLSSGYYVCTVREGDTLSYTMEMPVVRVHADERVEEDRERVAVMRGPVVYCAEQVDNPGYAPEYFHAFKNLSKDTELTAAFEPELLGGVVTISGEGIKLVPYYAWDNREPGAMAVWLLEN
ncbi:MAG: glycoside hydrolase family 127 protein [Provencibacterium sp.]|jgi:DUF1680 family protein|nr:glycoside hydrolase family 127 protein [Provencibacterium sp.]